MSGYCYKWEHKYDQHLIYIGSTKDIKQRENTHRSYCHNTNSKEYNKTFYEYVRKYTTIDHWKMTELYKGPDFRIFEKNYIKSTWEYNLNDDIPLRTKQERKDYLQAYRKDNKERINNIRKEKIPCGICGAIIRKGYMSRHKKTKKCMAFK